MMTNVTDIETLVSQQNFFYLGEGSYNQVFKSEQPFTINGRFGHWVRKDAYPITEYYYLRSNNSQIIFLYRDGGYLFNRDGHLSPYYPNLKQIKNQYYINSLKLREQLFIQFQDHMFFVDMRNRESAPIIIKYNNNSSTIQSINRVMNRGFHKKMHRGDYYAEPRRMSIRQLRHLCDVFQLNIPDIRLNSYNIKQRTVRLHREFNPDMPVYALSENQMVMLFYNQTPSDQEIAEQVIAIYLRTRRIIIDASGRDNFKVHDGEVICIDPEMSTRRRRSIGSEDIFKDLFDNPDYNEMHEFFFKTAQTSPKTTMVVKGLLYLEAYFSEQDLFDTYELAKFLNSDFLSSIHLFSLHQLPLLEADLRFLIHAAPFIAKYSLNHISAPKTTHIYSLLLFRLIEMNQIQDMKDILEHLDSFQLINRSFALEFEDYNYRIFEDIINNSSDSVLTYAIRIGAVDCMRLLLKHGADPSYRISGLYDAFHICINLEKKDVLKLIFTRGRESNFSSTCNYFSAEQPDYQLLENFERVTDVKFNQYFIQIVEFMHFISHEISRNSPEMKALEQLVFDLSFAKRNLIMPSTVLQKNEKIESFYKDCHQALQGKQDLLHSLFAMYHQSEYQGFQEMFEFKLSTMTQLEAV